jgi:hypothetical protein
MVKDSIYKTVTVKFTSESEPVTLEITSSYMTHGKYRIAMVSDKAFDVIGSGDLRDEIPDVHLIPLKPEDLKRKPLFIIGNYSPANPHHSNMISVRYEFRQKNKILQKPIEINVNYAGIFHTNHVVKFAKAR